jgi:RND family efflux transporter MFP subunit
VPPALELVVNVEESQLGQVAEGQSVQLSVPAFPGQTFTGTVRSIAPTVDARSRTAAVRVEPKDDASKLRAGMFAQLRIVTGERSDALVVPNEALVGGNSVVVIDANNMAHRVPLQLGLRGERVAEILGGLAPDQVVAISNPADLHDGDVVAPQINTAVALAH